MHITVLPNRFRRRLADRSLEPYGIVGNHELHATETELYTLVERDRFDLLAVRYLGQADLRGSSAVTSTSSFP